MRRGMTAAPLLLVVAAVAGAGFIVLLPVQGLVDGAMHLEGAVTLRQSLAGLHPPAAAYLTWFPVPVPNLLPELSLALLTSFLSAYSAEKVLLVGYVISFPLAFLYALRGVRRGADWLALFAIAYTFSLPVNYGFYNFIYSIVLFLVLAGYSLRLGERASPGRWGVLGALLVATYLTHAVGFLEAVLFIGVILVWPRLASSVRTRVNVILLATPVVLLVLASIAGLAGVVPMGKVETRWSWFAGTIALTHGLVTFSRLEIIVGVLLALTLIVPLAASLRRQGRVRLDRPRDALLVVTLLNVLGVILAPTRLPIGGSVIGERFALFAALSFVLWVASYELSAIALRRAGVVFVVAGVALTLIRIPAYNEIRNASADFATAGRCIARNSTLLQADLHLPNQDHPAWRVQPLADEAGRVAAATHGIDLGNDEWSVPYYLLRFKGDRDPYQWIPNPPGAIEQIPPDFNLLRYERRTGGQVDYVLVTGRSRAPAKILASPQWRSLHGQLMRMYRKVYTSPAGWVEVWERREPALDRAGEKTRAAADCDVGSSPQATS